MKKFVHFVFMVSLVLMIVLALGCSSPKALPLSREDETLKFGEAGINLIQEVDSKDSSKILVDSPARRNVISTGSIGNPCLF